MPVTTRSKTTTPTKEKKLKSVEFCDTKEGEKTCVLTPKVESFSLEITPTGSHSKMTMVEDDGKKKTEIYSETIKKVSFPDASNDKLFKFRTPWLRKLYIDFCMKTDLYINPDYVYYEYNEETGVYRIPMDDNFHNTLASIYHNEGIYLIPEEDLYVEIMDSKWGEKPVWCMQFRTKDLLFDDDTDVENFVFPKLATETLISWFINCEFNDNLFVTYKLNNFSRVFYMAIMMNFWSRGIYTIAEFNPEVFQFRFYNPTHNEFC